LSPVFGRERVSERQLDLLAERIRRESSASLARSIAGDALSGRDFEQFVMRGIAARGVRFTHASDKPVWLLAVDEKYYFGFPRFNFHDVPGRQRTSEREGSLPSVVAAAMVFAAKPGKDEVIWDPVMGTGTVLNEAAYMAPGAHLIGSDIDPEAVDLAKKRLPRQCRVRVLQGDVARVRLDELVSLTVANLPFGKRFKPAGGNALFYETVLRRSLEHSGNAWRGCFLTSDAGSLRTAVEAIGGLAISEVARPTVRGTQAAILIVNRA
jgi:tRNA G10  N-methylase Trm11